VREWPARLVLLGHPLGHTLSPRMQNAALKQAAIPLAFEALDVPRHALEDTLADLRRARAAGNVTIPYKEDVLAACDRLTDAARGVGAVNTFWTAVDGAMVGDNTDAPGFDAAARRLLGAPPPDARVAVLGAGGGAAAVLYALEKWDVAAIRLYSRSVDRAQKLIARFPLLPSTVAASADEAVQGATIIVNATPVGLHDDATPITVDALTSLHASSAVLDLAYRKGETALVRTARARGLRAQDGLPMLLEQGALAFERWFSLEPDREAMWRALAESR
jgi:shikimate dehydrogenase